MQETITLNIAQDVVASVINNEADKEQRMVDLITRHMAELQAMIESYWFTRKASVLNVAVSHDSVRFTTAVSGMFVAKYTVSYFFACDDITTNNTEAMTCTFGIDLSRHVVTITGEMQPERGPDEF